MPSKLLLFVLAVVLLASNGPNALAKPLQWQDATVFVGDGLYDSGVHIVHGLYLIKTDKITYAIPNYSTGLLRERWLVLTAGGPTKIALDGRHIHILDAEGKDREVRLVWKIATKQ